MVNTQTPTRQGSAGGKKEGMKEKYTLKMFMEDYEGFDWKNGTVIIIKKSTCKSFITEGCYKTLINKYSNEHVYGWNHNEKIMIITLDI